MVCEKKYTKLYLFKINIYQSVQSDMIPMYLYLNAKIKTTAKL